MSRSPINTPKPTFESGRAERHVDAICRAANGGFLAGASRGREKTSPEETRPEETADSVSTGLRELVAQGLEQLCAIHAAEAGTRIPSRHREIRTVGPGRRVAESGRRRSLSKPVQRRVDKPAPPSQGLI